VTNETPIRKVSLASAAEGELQCGLTLAGQLHFPEMKYAYRVTEENGRHVTVKVQKLAPSNEGRTEKRQEELY